MTPSNQPHPTPAPHDGRRQAYSDTQLLDKVEAMLREEVPILWHTREKKWWIGWILYASFREAIAQQPAPREPDAGTGEARQVHPPSAAAGLLQRLKELEAYCEDRLRNTGPGESLGLDDVSKEMKLLRKQIADTSPISPAQPMGGESGTPEKRKSLRTHLVESAAFWFGVSRIAQDNGEMGLAVFAMENAYNHVENALAAAQDALHAAEAERDALKNVETRVMADRAYLLSVIELRINEANLAVAALASARQRIAELEALVAKSDQ